jgi:hypothetical protein
MVSTMDDSVKTGRAEVPVGSARQRVSQARRTGALVALALAGSGLMSVVSAQPAHAAPLTCTAIGLFDSTGPAQVGVPKDHTGNPRCVMGMGNQGPAVRLLQESLIACYRRPLAPDGIFGSRTKEQLQAVQRMSSVDDDGVYGPITARAMLHRTANPPYPCYRARIS